MANFVIVIYSLYHHIAALAEQVKAGIESTGNKATIYQVPETLSEQVLEQLHAPAKPDYPIATPDILSKSDGIIFGAPTRFGAFPAQLKAFIDATGGQWASGALYQKPAGVFFSTGTGSGREFTVVSLLSTFAHHGMIYIPLGYAGAFAELSNVSEVHGASAWGAGTIAGADGSRQPTELENKIATVQGESFAKLASKLVDTKEKPDATEKEVVAKEKEVKEEAPKKEEVAKAPAATATEKKTTSPKAAEKSSCCVIV